jgi:hypothetical protein
MFALFCDPYKISAPAILISEIQKVIGKAVPVLN